MKLQINVSDSMAKKIDAMAAEVGVTRSAYCSMILGQYIMGLEKTYDALKDVGFKLAEDSKRNYEK